MKTQILCLWIVFYIIYVLLALPTHKWAGVRFKEDNFYYFYLFCTVLKTHIKLKIKIHKQKNWVLYYFRTFWMTVSFWQNELSSNVTNRILIHPNSVNMRFSYKQTFLWINKSTWGAVQKSMLKKINDKVHRKIAVLNPNR